MSGFLAIGLVAGGLIAVALVILAADVARGDVGGGRHTMARARRVLVVSTDQRTSVAAESWIDEQRRENPQMQCFVLAGADDQETFMAIQDAVERHRPDAVVVSRHPEDSHSTLDGLFGRVKEDLHIPVDAIYLEGNA